MLDMAGTFGRSILIALLLATVVTASCGCAGPSSELRAGVRGTLEQGMASYYAPRLAGHRTASGERYDPSKLTAAHPSVPFGTYVRVVRTDASHRWVTVRINDRCAGSRKIIEVSEAAARQLDMMRAGLIPVQLEIVAPPP